MADFKINLHLLPEEIETVLFVSGFLPKGRIDKIFYCQMIVSAFGEELVKLDIRDHDVSWCESIILASLSLHDDGWRLNAEAKELYSTINLLPKVFRAPDDWLVNHASPEAKLEDLLFSPDDDLDDGLIMTSGHWQGHDDDIDFEAIFNSNWKKLFH
jgi:hypothetical protein